MYTSSPTKSVQKTRSAGSACCDDPDCGSGLRNRYFLGKQLSPHSFEAEQRHLLERRRLLNRAIHGWGVVYGFELEKTSSAALRIKPGLALDATGRELVQSEELIRAANEFIVLDQKGQQTELDKIGKVECWLLSAHYAEQDTDPVKVSDACNCEHWEWNYTCETVRYSLQPNDCTACCEEPGCEWKCECDTEGWCDESDGIGKRGGRCLCDQITKWSPGSERDFLCEIEEPCGSVRVDLHNGVPLACVKFIPNECEPWTLDQVEACAPRQMVMRNDLLLDLIQGCDLTRIKDYGWKPWHRRPTPSEPNAVPFQEFADAFAEASGHDDTYITKGFWVEFSRPVRRETVRQDCFVMTIITSETDDRWWETARVPVVGVYTADAELIDRAVIVVDGRWFRGTVGSDSSRFQTKATRVELEVRGDFIIDCNGQMVDANGNGTPGGTFISTFLVDAAPESIPPQKNEERFKGVS